MFPLNRAHAAWLLAVLLAGSVALGLSWRKRSAPPAPVVVTATPPSRGVGSARQAKGPVDAIYVHVAGYVAKPGVYRLAPGARVLDAVAAAGGGTAEAYTDALNLASPLHDGEKLYVPTVGEPPPAESAGYVTEPAPAATPSPPPEPEPESLPTESSAFRFAEDAGTEADVAPRPRSSTSTKLREPGQGTVHINSASSAELQRLPGVGPSTASKIIEYREQNGGFRTVEELMEVRGIGPKKLAKMRPFVSVP